MADWKSFLKADPLPWLLEEENPSVRYLTLTKILGKTETDPEVIQARGAIMARGAVPQILDRQADGGYWADPKAFYRAKYKGTVWQLIILAELNADGRDPRVRAACEFILDHSQHVESGGFSASSYVREPGGYKSEVIPCLTGNMVWSLLRLGYESDPRLQRGLDWITTYQRFDDGDGPVLGEWPYDHYDMCWGRHTCHLGAVKALKALAEISAERQTPETARVTREGAEYFLLHHIYRRSHDLSKVSKPGWLRLGFPLMYQTDILEILGILTHLGYRDERMQEAVDKVVSRQDDTGRWILQETFNGRFQVDIEKKGELSKWITFRALEVLQRYYG